MELPQRIPAPQNWILTSTPSEIMLEPMKKRKHLPAPATSAKPSEPVMPRPVPESSVGQVVNAVLLTVPDGVPVETADLSDLPPQYRAILKEDNTVTEPTPGQTSNV